MGNTKKKSTRFDKVQGFESWRPFLSQPLLFNGGCDHRPAKNKDDDNRASSPPLLRGIHDCMELAELTDTQKVVRDTATNFKFPDLTDGVNDGDYYSSKCIQKDQFV